jgi:hypothetical protein
MVKTFNKTNRLLITIINNERYISYEVFRIKYTHTDMNIPEFLIFMLLNWHVTP